MEVNIRSTHGDLFYSKLTPWFDSLTMQGPPIDFLPPMDEVTRQEVIRIRQVNAELMLKRAEEERIAEEKKASESDTPQEENAPEDALESDDEEIPPASAQSHHSAKLTLFMPSKKADADESLFTKFA